MDHACLSKQTGHRYSMPETKLGWGMGAGGGGRHLVISGAACSWSLATCKLQPRIARLSRDLFIVPYPVPYISHPPRPPRLPIVPFLARRIPMRRHRSRFAFINRSCERRPSISGTYQSYGFVRDKPKIFLHFSGRLRPSKFETIFRAYFLRTCSCFTIILFFLLDTGYKWNYKAILTVIPMYKFIVGFVLCISWDGCKICLSFKCSYLWFELALQFYFHSPRGGNLR